MRILVIGRSDIIFIKRLLQNIHHLGRADLAIDLFDNRHYEEEVCRNEIPYSVYGLQTPQWCRRFFSIPVIRIFARMYFEYATLRQLLRHCHYDAINIQELPFYSWIYVACAHRHSVKTILTPIGSDALRTQGWTGWLLRKGFDRTDYVTITTGSGFAEKVLSKFCIDSNKVRNLSYGSDAISEIIEMKGHYTREELAQLLHIPYANYYICCGYNAYRAQNHTDMLRAIAANKERLPEGYKVIFLLGYGGGEPIRQELETENAQYGLDVVYMMDYLSPKEVAAQRLLTDLFIHIQDTDAHCFTMREFLLADTQVINGQWLSYPELEQEGIPYYVCESKDALKGFLTSFFNKELSPVHCPEALKKHLADNSWNNVASCWVDFYTSLS